MKEPVSATEDFGSINRRLRELRGDKDDVKNDETCVCLGAGWIYQHKPYRDSRAWKVAICPVCKNPEGKKQPA